MDDFEHQHMAMLAVVTVWLTVVLAVVTALSLAGVPI